METTLQNEEHRQQEHSSLATFLRSRGYLGFSMERSAVGHFQLHVSVNGHEALMFLDTGASVTVFDQRSAPKLGLEPEASDEKGGGLGASEVAVSSCQVDSFLLDRIELQAIQVFVMDLSHVNQALDGRGAQRADGVIGADILNERSAIIDYGDGTLYLKRETETVSGGGGEAP